MHSAGSNGPVLFNAQLCFSAPNVSSAVKSRGAPVLVGSISESLSTKPDDELFFKDRFHAAFLSNIRQHAFFSVRKIICRNASFLQRVAASA